MKISEQSNSANLNYTQLYAKNSSTKADKINNLDNPENNKLNNLNKLISNFDKIFLSNQAKEILEAKKALDLIPDIREEKVKELKEKIQNKTYKFDANKIASNILKESLINDMQIIYNSNN